MLSLLPLEPMHPSVVLVQQKSRVRASGTAFCYIIIRTLSELRLPAISRPKLVPAILILISLLSQDAGGMLGIEQEGERGERSLHSIPSHRHECGTIVCHSHYNKERRGRRQRVRIPSMWCTAVKSQHETRISVLEIFCPIFMLGVRVSVCERVGLSVCGDAASFTMCVMPLM